MYIVLIIVAIAFIIIVIKNRKDKTINTDTLSKQEEDYQKILTKFNVPKEHYKIVIAQSRAHNIYNCPSLIWKENDIIKMVLLKTNPELVEHEAEDFMFISSSPFVNFKQYDGTYFPNWASLSRYVKDLFTPYIEEGVACGGIDYDRQTYWAGIFCVYAPSLNQIFQMMNRPLKDYKLSIDNIQRFKEDGSCPIEMLNEYHLFKETKAKKQEEIKENKNDQNMNAVWEAIHRLEKQKDESSIDEINKLNAYLIKEKRFDDLEKSTKDKNFQQELLKELNK